MIVEMMSVPLDCGICRRIMMQFNLSASDRKLRAIGHGFNPISFRTYTCTSSQWRICVILLLLRSPF